MVLNKQSLNKKNANSYLNIFLSRYLKVYENREYAYFVGYLSAKACRMLYGASLSLAFKHLVVKPSVFDDFIKLIRNHRKKIPFAIDIQPNQFIILSYKSLPLYIYRGVKAYKQANLFNERVRTAISLIYNENYSLRKAAKEVDLSVATLSRILKRSGLSIRKSPYKMSLKRLAKKYYRQGYSIRKIACIIGVSKSTVGRWIKDGMG